jgi:5-methylcytosine-specific restriction endonuclease McrA
MSQILVIDQQKQPLDPVHPGRARFLLSAGHAAIYRRYPFVIIMKDAKPDAQPAPLRVKIDPGSKTTGLAVVSDATGEVVWAAELAHHGQQVKEALDDRRAHRRSRRSRHTRYREPRFDNRARRSGWLPPSLVSRIQNVVTWVERLRRYAPVGAISYELVRFDTQLIEHPDISGIEYQWGTLAGCEAREYLLLKWNYRCAYCGKEATRWEVDHIIPRIRGGSNRLSNLALSCHGCNQEKGGQTAAEYGYPEVQAEAKQPLKDAAAVNSTRWALYERLRKMGLPVETSTGGRTKWNRTQRGFPKTHWLDAACVGASTPQHLRWDQVHPLMIRATGRQCRQMQNVDENGFPTGNPKSMTRVMGFRTGDMVRAVVPPGLVTSGTHLGRVLVRATGRFDIRIASRRIKGVGAAYCAAIHHQDGYAYAIGKEAALPPLG